MPVWNDSCVPGSGGWSWADKAAIIKCGHPAKIAAPGDGGDLDTLGGESDDEGDLAAGGENTAPALIRCSCEPCVILPIISIIDTPSGLELATNP